MNIKDYIGSILCFFFGIILFCSQPNLGALYLILLGVWYVPVIHEYFISKIRFKERIINLGKKNCEKQNKPFDENMEKMYTFLYYTYDVIIRLIVFIVIVSSTHTYFAPTEVFYAKSNIPIYDINLKQIKTLKQFEKITIYPTIKKDAAYYETKNANFVKIDDVLNEKDYKIALEKYNAALEEVKKIKAKAFAEKKKAAEKLVDGLLRSKLITDVDSNSIGQKVYYFDEVAWYSLEYKNKELLYEALKILNSVDNGNNVNSFYLKGSHSGKTFIDIFGVK